MRINGPLSRESVKLLMNVLSEGDRRIRMISINNSTRYANANETLFSEINHFLNTS